MVGLPYTLFASASNTFREARISAGNVYHAPKDCLGVGGNVETS